MMGKNPLDYVKGRKFTKEEVVEALRIAIIAELDAVNLYLQFARMIEDENIRKLFEEVAREEKTHIGEFMHALKMLDREQAQELEKGAREVKEIIGS